MLDMSLFRRGTFSGAILVNLLSVVGLVGFLYFVAQHLQLVVGLSPMVAGFALLPGLVLMIVSGLAVVPVAKREGNPFPERLTVGRATNSDVLLRVPFVSKVHAHVIREPDGSFSIHDNNPSNRTYLRNRVLEAGATRKLDVGDSVAFGSLEFEFVDAGRLYDILIAECGSTR